VREGEEPGVAHAPGIELRHDRLEQSPAHSLIPEVWSHRQGTEEPDAAPVGHEHGACQLSLDLGSVGGGRVGAPASPDEVGIAHEAQGVGKAQEGAERQPHDAIGCR
jgi:hypothetical protein